VPCVPPMVAPYPAMALPPLRPPNSIDLEPPAALAAPSPSNCPAKPAPPAEEAFESNRRFEPRFALSELHEQRRRHAAVSESLTDELVMHGDEVECRGARAAITRAR
jgi:hypothetical protein